ncbi:hypothetical protein WQQ_25170 [Hydrocarboniphaga effusa AP103]|uniref:Uncharacterized protein n=1 Tax=Hydrocarboniphaga effusa AP103 TaxID=1172194 RepID=I8T4S6_9GAMM|nr:hypothetical protein WQQ_25170 [Hydrocarboniphaga effusa AP103]
MPFFPSLRERDRGEGPVRRKQVQRCESSTLPSPQRERS